MSASYITVNTGVAFGSPLTWGEVKVSINPIDVKKAPGLPAAINKDMYWFGQWSNLTVSTNANFALHVTYISQVPTEVGQAPATADNAIIERANQLPDYAWRYMPDPVWDPTNLNPYEKADADLGKMVRSGYTGIDKGLATPREQMTPADWAGQNGGVLPGFSPASGLGGYRSDAAIAEAARRGSEADARAADRSTSPVAAPGLLPATSFSFPRPISMRC